MFRCLEQEVVTKYPGICLHRAWGRTMCRLD